ncbi:hypothetical protein QAD02_022219 [Eretmocerus hayati]|uniref:Uncharacterized protein n=1 Tax=Eretmocerus hayati TaxID=131215 RepID=A0ACC2PS38_9HYME|nr:hypothetical protein QAD02_022219 [Eretmocerus hayati]
MVDGLIALRLWALSIVTLPLCLVLPPRFSIPSSSLAIFTTTLPLPHTSFYYLDAVPTKVSTSEQFTLHMPSTLNSRDPDHHQHTAARAKRAFIVRPEVKRGSSFVLQHLDSLLPPLSLENF